MKRNQSGFTLIEIAIVLVIIGLLLGGVLKGQELINSARVKNLATDFRNVPIFIYGYQDKFRSLPGDDATIGTANSHLANATPCTGAPAVTANRCNVGNGLINGAWNSVDPADESFVFWQHIRLAGMATGSVDANGTDPTYLPRNANGGIIGVQSNVNFATINLPTVMTGTYIVCSEGILGKFVLQLDTTLDDGNPQTGSMRAIQSGQAGAAVTGAFVTGNEGAAFTVCQSV